MDKLLLKVITLGEFRGGGASEELSFSFVVFLFAFGEGLGAPASAQEVVG